MAKFLNQIHQLLISKPFTVYGSLVIALLGLYGTFLYKNEPELRFEVLSNTGVFDIHERLGKLDILYGGRSLKATNKSLRIITFRVINSGAADIRKSDYDENEPLGFSISTGEILETPQLRTNDSYISKNLKLTTHDSKKVTFSPIIINPNDFFDIEILLSVAESTTPNIIPLGKIAGVKVIKLTEPYRENIRETFWHNIAQGSPLVHFTRFIIYVSVFIALSVILSIPFSLGSAAFEKAEEQYKNNKVEEFKKNLNRHPTKGEEYLFRMYKNSDDTAISALRDMILTEDDFKELNLHHTAHHYYPRGEYEKLEKAGLLSKDKLASVVSELTRETLLNFLYFINKGRLDRHHKTNKEVTK